MDPLFSVIIPTCRRPERLARCLDRLAPGKQTLDESRYEVIVSDDGRDDATKLMVGRKYPWARWVRGPDRGPAANRNNGARYAKGAWLAFTDDDCLPDEGWLEAYQSAKEKHPEIKVFEGRIYADRPKERLDEEAPINENGGYLWSCNFAIEREYFFKLGKFDERFIYAAMEDVDLRYRIKRDGNSFLFIPMASICHPWRRIKGWNIHKKRILSTKLYLTIHPEENKRLNGKHFFIVFCRNVLKGTLIGLWTFKGRGFVGEMVKNFSFLYQAVVLGL